MKINGIHEDHYDAVLKKFEHERARAYARWLNYLYLKQCRAKVGGIPDWHFGPFEKNEGELACVLCGGPPDPHTVFQR